MATNTNPGRSLSRRIRASLDVKRSKTEDSIPMSPPMSPTSPTFTKHFATQDPTILRDAVAEAINDSAFQSAIAAHLAKLVEPAIKSALDTIQPVVEKVYQHEISLRKLNGSVEDILLTLHPAARGGSDKPSVSYSKDSISTDEVQQMPAEHNSESSKGMSELSSYLADIRGAITSAVADIAEIKSASAVSTQNLSAVKQILGQSNTDSSEIQAQLALLKAEIGNVLADVNLHGNNIKQIRDASSNSEILTAVQTSHASHSKALDELKAMDRSFTAATIPVFEKSHADTASAFDILAVNLKSLDQNLRTVSATNGNSFSDLKAKIDGIRSTIETVKTREPSGDVLAAVQKSNDFHLAHAARLDQINQKYTAPTSENPLPDYRDNLAALKEQITSLTMAADSHTSTLQEVQRTISGDIAPSVKGLAGLEQQLNNLSATLNLQHDLLTETKEADKSTEILTALQESNDSHSAHSSALGHLLDRDSSNEILTAIHESHDSHTANIDEIKVATKSANELHASHTSALEAIQAANDDAAKRLAAHTGSLEAFGTHMETVLVKLQEHSTVHSQIKDAVHASHDTLTSNAASLEKTQVNSSELLDTAKDTHTLLKTQHSALVSHNAVLEEIKSSNKQEEIINNISVVKLIVEESKTSIDVHGSVVKDLHSSVGKSTANISDNLQALTSGVHLNDKGLGQLKDHVKVSNAAGENDLSLSRDIDGEPEVQKSYMDPFTRHIPETGVAALAAVAGGGLAIAASKELEHPATEPTEKSREVQSESATEAEQTMEMPTENTWPITETDASVIPAPVMESCVLEEPNVEERFIQNAVTEDIPAEEISAEDFYGETIDASDKVPNEVPYEETTEIPYEETTDAPYEETTEIPCDEETTNGPCEENTEIPYEVIDEDAHVGEVSTEVSHETNTGEAPSELSEVPVEEPYSEVSKEATSANQLMEELPAEELVHALPASEYTPEQQAAEEPIKNSQSNEEPAVEESLLAAFSTEEPNVNDVATDEPIAEQAVAEELSTEGLAAEVPADDLLETAKASNVKHQSIERETVEGDFALDKHDREEQASEESVVKGPVEEPLATESTMETEPNLASEPERVIDNPAIDMHGGHHIDVKSPVSDESTEPEPIAGYKPVTDIEPTTEAKVEPVEQLVEDPAVEAPSIKGHQAEEEKLAKEDEPTRDAQAVQEVAQSTEATVVPEGYVKKVRFLQDEAAGKPVSDHKSTLHDSTIKSDLEEKAKEDLPVEKTEPELDQPIMEKPSDDALTTETTALKDPTTTPSSATEEVAPQPKPTTEESSHKTLTMEEPDTETSDTKKPTVAVEAVGSSEMV